MHMQSEPPYVTTYRKRRPSKTPRHHKRLSQSPMAETSCIQLNLHILGGGF